MNEGAWSDAAIREFLAGAPGAPLDRFAVDAHARRVPLPAWLADLALSDQVVSQDRSVLAGMHPGDVARLMAMQQDEGRRPGAVIEGTVRALVEGEWHEVAVREALLGHDERVGCQLVTYSDLGPCPTPSSATSATTEPESPAWVLLYLDTLTQVHGAEGRTHELFGLERDEMIGCTVAEWFDPEVQGELASLWMDLLGEPGGVRTTRAPMPSRDGGDDTWVECTMVNHLETRPHGAMMVIIHDISEKRRRDDELRAGQDELRLLAEKVPTAMFRLDPTGIVEFGNARWLHLFGAGSTGGPLDVLVHPDDRAAVRDALASFAGVVGEASTTVEVRDLAGERTFELALSAVVRDGRPPAVLGAAQEVTTTAVLRHRADHDGLTGLLNRHALDVATNALLASSHDVICVFLDLDGFKEVNDEHGHEAGDTVLIAVADRLVSNVRNGALVGRWGGDEFVVISAGVGPDDVTPLVERLRRSVCEPMVWGDRWWSVGVSIGATRWRAGDDVHSLIRRADEGMYAEKRGRRGLV